MANRKGKNGSRDRFYFRGLWTVTAAMKLNKTLAPLPSWPDHDDRWLTEPLEHPASQPSQGILGTALCAISPLFTRGNRLRVGHEIRVEPVLSPPLSCLPRSYGRAALSWWGQGPGVPMLAMGLASEHLWQGARNVGMDPGTCQYFGEFFFSSN